MSENKILKKYRVSYLFPYETQINYEDVEAYDYDHAAEIVENLFNGHVIGEIERIYETSLKGTYVIVPMPDGYDYALSWIDVANHRTRALSGTLDEDQLENFMEKDTIPLFERSSEAMTAWAHKHMAWKDVKAKLLQLQNKRPSDEEFQKSWEENEKSIVQFEKSNTKRLL